MASFTPGNGKAATNGTTEVDLVAAPSSGSFRIVRSVSVHNRDTVSRTVTVRVDDGTDYDIVALTIAAGEIGTFDSPINLTSSDTLKVVSDATATTTEPLAFASYVEV
jgi:uncharacterized protein YqfA (UPF0365 family)